MVPASGREETDDVFEQHALARPAFAHDRGDLVLVNLQIDPVEDGPVAKPLGHVPEFDERSFHSLPST